MTTSTTPTQRVAIYARVSSDQQAQEQTIASQVAALRERITHDGHTLDEELCFIDDGVNGSTLMRPALERLRDIAYVSGFQKLYVHSPDRLARRYAYQVLLVDELTKHGVEIEFLNRSIGVSPEEDLLLQMQGMFAEYERAKIMERSRRGKRHGAARGRVNVLSGAPCGYRYISKRDGGGEASYEIIEEQAPIVKQIFEWVGRDRISIGEVSRRLKQQGALSARGKSWWDRTSVWAMLKNPAYMGSAAFGKTENKTGSDWRKDAKDGLFFRGGLVERAAGWQNLRRTTNNGGTCSGGADSARRQPNARPTAKRCHPGRRSRCLSRLEPLRPSRLAVWVRSAYQKELQLSQEVDLPAARRVGADLCHRCLRLRDSF